MKHLNFISLGASVFCAATALLAQSTLNPLPSREVGQPRMQATSASPNGVEGREVNRPQGIALDTTASPPILYVADTVNNRVLAWRNPVSASNGAKADLILGQRDEFTTLPQGPRSPAGSTLSTGLFQPTGLVVDSGGNLYIADTGNNRILRFPRPFDQPPGLQLPDFVIGQPSFNSGSPGSTPPLPSPTTLALSTGTNNSISGFVVGLAFDSQNNLWVSDAANHRVIRFPASALASGQPSGPAADRVLGQQDYVTRAALPVNTNNRLVKAPVSTTAGPAYINTPAGIAFDPSGRLFVIDGLSRVLVYNPPFPQGSFASRIMGVSTKPVVDETGLNNPQGITMQGASPLVVDFSAHRILRFPPYDQWPAEATTFSPAANGVIGQGDFGASSPNRGLREAAEMTLFGPVAAAVASNALYVADTFNNRILVFPDNGGNFIAANKVFGQVAFSYTAPNLVEGRELNVYSGIDQQTSSGRSPLPLGSAVIDGSSSPPVLYVADTFNNRILGYRDARRVRPGDKADLVIGQGTGDASFYRSVANYGSAAASTPNDSGLNGPAGVAVDASGNLYVADFGNSRVLRFPTPFQQRANTIQRANLVLGQAGFTTPPTTDATARTMAAPFGLAFTVEGHLLVSDAVHNRVLLFRKPDGGDFTNGMNAFAVIGQPDFISVTGSSAENRMITPRDIATDTDDRLYVADYGNNRILIFSRAAVPSADPSSVLTLTNVDRVGARLRGPVGVYVSRNTGEVWVTESGAGRVVRYPRFDVLTSNALADSSVVANTPVGVTQDDAGNLYVTEAINRVTMYYSLMLPTNAANGMQATTSRPLSPGQYVSLYPPTENLIFAGNTEVFSTVPMPTALADTQVLVNDRPVPLHFVAPRQINFLTPMDLPTSGTAEIQVVRPSTGEIIAVSMVPLGPVAPGLFTQGSVGYGQAAALNQDGVTINSVSAPAARGEVISLFGTGQGFIPGAPADGSTPDGKQILAPENLRVFMNALELDRSDILYSGLAPNLIGTWQINVKIPSRVPPGNAIPIVISLRDIPNIDPQNAATRTTIAVKQ